MKKSTKFVLVRTFSAGVHFGVLHSQKGKEVTLRNARRIWSWKGANTLSEIAISGVGEGSRVSVAVPEILLTEAVEVISCTKEAQKNLEGASWTK